MATSTRRERYFRSLREAIGFDYPFSVIPYFVQGETLDRLSETTGALLRLLMAPGYQARVAATPWLLPQTPVEPADCHGAMDFHVVDDEARLIEVNFTPPGFLGFNRLPEEVLFDILELPPSGQVNADFEERLVRSVCAPGWTGKLAIAVNHTQVSAYFRPHYRYVETIFRRLGVDADMVFAAEVDAAGERPRWHGKSYDRVFNLVIPRLIEHQPEAFPNYIRLYHRQQDRVLPRPFGWRLGSKAFLTTCRRIDEETFGLSEADRTLIRHVSLDARLLDEFAHPDDVVTHFGGLDRLVLKPLDNYDARGVFIQPGYAELAKVFAEERPIYVVQGYFPHGSHPFVTAEGVSKPHLLCVRVGFAGGEVCGIRARSFEKSAANCFMTPVVRI